LLKLVRTAGGVAREARKEEENIFCPTDTGFATESSGWSNSLGGVVVDVVGDAAQV